MVNKRCKSAYQQAAENASNVTMIIFQIDSKNYSM